MVNASNCFLNNYFLEENQFPSFPVEKILLRIKPKIKYTTTAIDEPIMFVVINLLCKFGAIVDDTVNILYRKKITNEAIISIQNQDLLLPGSLGFEPPSNLIAFEIKAATNSIIAPIIAPKM